MSAATTMVTVLATAPRVAADPKEDPCEIVRGPARDYCEQGEDSGGAGSGGGPADPPIDDGGVDPLGMLADGITKAAAWIVDRLSDAVARTGDVDFTNGGFLRTYAIVFAASAFLTTLLWLWAVVKRAVRGVPLTTALTEAVGLLWLTVIASAFTPLVLYTVVSAVDSITDGLTGGRSSSPFFQAFSEALRKKGADGIGGGPIMRILVGLAAIVLSGIIWLELAMRAALLYVGGVLGTLVYAGLVDKDLWGRVRRWAGIMSAITLVKPILVIVLALASAITAGDAAQDTGAVISGLAILLIAIIASGALFALIPGMGDDIVSARRNFYDPASQQSKAAVMRPAGIMKQGISTHSGRDSVVRTASESASGGGGGGGQPQQAAGMSAHASRQPNPPPQQQRSPGAAPSSGSGGGQQNAP